MSEALVRVSVEKAGVALITLNRPEKRNALSISLMQQLSQTLEKVHSSPEVRVIIFSANGPTFCAGMDLEEAADPQKKDESAKLIAVMLQQIYSSDRLTIAAVQGAAIAGGAGLMSACDFALADEKALFGYPEVRRGLVAAQVMIFLTKQLRERDMRELLLFGELIDAQRALSMGLINRIVKEGDLLSEAYRYASFALKGAPKAAALTKKLIDELSPSNIFDDLSHALSVHREMRLSDEAKEGIAAFLEKRKPWWDQ